MKKLVKLFVVTVVTLVVLSVGAGAGILFIALFVELLNKLSKSGHYAIGAVLMVVAFVLLWTQINNSFGGKEKDE